MGGDKRMKVSAVVLDLDGTYLDSRKQVSERNLKAVLACHEQGIPILIATARPPRSVQDLLPEPIRNIGIIIYYNGALIINEALNLREHYPINPTISKELMDYIFSHESDPYLSVEAEDSWFSSRELDYMEMMHINHKPRVVSLEEMQQLSPSKILISHYDDVQPLIDRFGHKVNLVVTDSGTLIQISSKEASKENAVSRICERLGVPMEEVMVFGDDFNDAGLFQRCGYAIAMGNAIKELKDMAYEVTETNDNDGVAVVLERLCK